MQKIEDGLGIICLPDTCKILQPLPRLSAELGDGMVTVNLAAELVVWQAIRDRMDMPLPSDPQCEMSVVRQGPYGTGFERIVKSRIAKTNEFRCRWDLVLKDGARLGIACITGSGTFIENKVVWNRIIDSIRYN